MNVVPVSYRRQKLAKILLHFITTTVILVSFELKIHAYHTKAGFQIAVR